MDNGCAKRQGKRVYGVNVETQCKIFFESVYKASKVMSGKCNTGLICNSINHVKLDGSPIIAYGHVWFYTDSETVKTPINVRKFYQKIPKEHQKKRGPVPKKVNANKEQTSVEYKCIVYDEAFNIVNKFLKITECSDYYGISYRSITSRLSRTLTKESKYPRFVNGLYFQQTELSTDIVQHFLNLKIK